MFELASQGGLRGGRSREKGDLSCKPVKFTHYAKHNKYPFSSISNFSMKNPKETHQLISRMDGENGNGGNE